MRRRPGGWECKFRAAGTVRVELDELVEKLVTNAFHDVFEVSVVASREFESHSARRNPDFSWNDVREVFSCYFSLSRGGPKVHPNSGGDRVFLEETAPGRDPRSCGSCGASIHMIVLSLGRKLMRGCMSGVLCGGTSIYRTRGGGRGLDLVSFVRVFSWGVPDKDPVYSQSRCS